jgi:hypothetical protein
MILRTDLGAPASCHRRTNVCNCPARNVSPPRAARRPIVGASPAPGVPVGVLSVPPVIAVSAVILLVSVSGVGAVVLLEDLTTSVRLSGILTLSLIDGTFPSVPGTGLPAEPAVCCLLGNELLERDEVLLRAEVLLRGIVVEPSLGVSETALVVRAQPADRNLAADP